MTQPLAITFQLGPLVIKIEGNDVVTKWACDLYAPLICYEEADLIFRFVDFPVHPCSEDAVSDGRTAVGNQTVSYSGRRYDMRITSGNPVMVELFQKDRRSLLMKSISDPEETWKMLLSHGDSLNIHWLKDFVYSIFPFVVQCMLSERHGALIHAGGFSVDGRGVLLPGWGGVGKSTIVSRAVLHGSAKFISDDFAVVNNKGTMFLHMLPIHAYAYHLDQDKELKKRIFESCSWLNRMFWPIGSTFRRHRAVRWISPAVTFGEDKLDNSAPIDHVIVLYRANTKDFILESLSPAAAASPSAGVLMSEISNFAERVARAETGWYRGPFPSLGNMYTLLLNTYSSAFSKSSCFRLMIPKDADGNALIAYLRARFPLIDAAFSETG